MSTSPAKPTPMPKDPREESGPAVVQAPSEVARDVLERHRELFERLAKK